MDVMDCLVLLDQLELMERMEREEKLVPWVLQDHLDQAVEV